jgi:hypothetical protein
VFAQVRPRAGSELRPVVVLELELKSRERVHSPVLGTFGGLEKLGQPLYTEQLALHGSGRGEVLPRLLGDLLDRRMKGPDVSAHGLDEELEDTPPGQPRGGEDGRDRGGAASRRTRQGTKARPACSVVQVVKSVHKFELRSRLNVGAR